MPAEVYKDRKAVVISWDPGDYDGPVTVRTESEEDVSETKLVANPGYAAVSFPLDHTGTFDVTVLDEDDNVVDEGTRLTVA